MPWGGEMSIFSPEATGNRTECTHSCTRIQAARLQSRKLTTLAMQGANALTDPAPQISVDALPRHSASGHALRHILRASVLARADPPMERCREEVCAQQGGLMRWLPFQVKW